MNDILGIKQFLKIGSWNSLLQIREDLIDNFNTVILTLKGFSNRIHGRPIPVQLLLVACRRTGIAAE